jgi:hypothetical protein
MCVATRGLVMPSPPPPPADDLPPNLSKIAREKAEGGPGDTRAATRAAAKRAGVELGLIGCGRVGRIIAGEFALCGAVVHAWDSHVEELAETIRRAVMTASLADPPEVVRQALTSSLDICERMQTVLSMSTNRAVVVATMDDVSVKRHVIEQAVQRNANIPILVCVADASDVKYVDSLGLQPSVLGVAFWPPILAEPRVALTPGSATSPAILQRATALFELLGKTVKIITGHQSQPVAPAPAPAPVPAPAPAQPKKMDDAAFPETKAPSSGGAFLGMFRALRATPAPAPSPATPKLPADTPQTTVTPTPATAAPAQVECVVCLEAKAIMAAVPCGHKCACQECAKLLKKCPLCRTDVTNFLRIFE